MFKNEASPYIFCIYFVKERFTHQNIFTGQDEGLEELSKILSRQKHIAHTIHNEVDQHNGMILVSDPSLF